MVLGMGLKSPDHFAINLKPYTTSFAFYMNIPVPLTITLTADGDQQVIYKIGLL